MSEKLRLKLGPYFSYVTSHKFEGSAYDGYLRQGDPTGPKVELGHEDGERGEYDFSERYAQLAVWHRRRCRLEFLEALGRLRGLNLGLIRSVQERLPRDRAVDVSHLRHHRTELSAEIGNLLQNILYIIMYRREKSIIS